MTDTEYKAVSRLKLDDFNYVERGTVVDTSNLDEEDIARLLEGGSIMDSETFDRTFSEANSGANQAWGTPSNLGRVEGTKMQVNPPANNPDDEAPDVRDAAPNPADVVPVEGATDPGEGAERDESDQEGAESDEEEAEPVTLDPSHEPAPPYDATTGNTPE
jgi:hypothetical protein